MKVHQGIFTDRVVDRGGDHTDHRRHRDPQPAAGAAVGQRIVGRRVVAAPLRARRLRITPRIRRSAMLPTSDRWAGRRRARRRRPRRACSTAFSRRLRRAARGKSGYYYLATGIIPAGATINAAFVAAQRPDVDAFHREPRLLLDQRWRTAFANGQRGRPSGEQPGVVPGVPGGTVANFLASRSHVRLRIGSQDPTSRITTHN